jgi:hypothetical protein
MATRRKNMTGTPTTVSAELPEALRLADTYASLHAKHELEHLYGTSTSYTQELFSKRVAARAALEKELRRQHAEIETLKAGYAAARLEIESLRAQVAPAVPAEDVALDAARYRWLCCKFGETRLPCALENMLEHGYIADGKPSIDAAIDAARAAQEGK